MRVGRVHEYITGKIARGEKLHFTLVDPDKPFTREGLEKTAKLMAEAGTDAFLIGGSIGVTPEEAGEAAGVLKETGLPVIVFPGNINCLTPRADAVLFMVLMNSNEPYYLMMAQVAAAPLVKKYGLEPLPTGYIVVYPDTAVSHMGRVQPIPVGKPEVVLAYALAGEMMGFKYIYLEAGSGSQQTVPPSFPAIVKKYTGLVTIVGGGIRSPEQAREMVKSGADVIVTGTIVEKDPELAVKIVKAVKSPQ